MAPIEYLKLQAKNLHKDFKTQTTSFDPKSGRKLYDYDPKYFKFDLLVHDFNINEDRFKLGNAQHVIAKLCGFTKWIELLKASPARTELAILLFDNMDRFEVRDWEQFISRIETENKVTIDDDFRLQIFQEAFLEREQDVFYDDYRLMPDERYVYDEEEHEEQIDGNESSSTVKITSIPLDKTDRKEFISTANYSFERVFERIEPENPELTRSFWNAEKFIFEEILRPERLPIDRDYALSLVESFMLGYVVQLAVRADKQKRDRN